MTCSKKYQKSSLRAYNTTEQTYATSGTITFSNSGYSSGTSIELNGNTVFLVHPGLYYVTLDTVVTNETANTEVTIQMQNNGVNVIGASSEVTVTAIGDLHPSTISAIIPVGCSCPCASQKGSAITFNVTGTTSVIANANLNVVKLA